MGGLDPQVSQILHRGTSGKNFILPNEVILAELGVGCQIVK
jgi:hypothetical protein